MLKSLTKRIRITKQGKVVRRPMGVNHMKTRRSTKNNRSKRLSLGLNYPLKNMSGR